MYRAEYLDYSSITIDNKSTNKIWWMNIGISETVEKNVNHFFPKFNNPYRPTVTATEQLCLFQANRHDIVILREQPPLEVLECVKIVKGYLPTVMYSEDKYNNFSESILADTNLLERLKKIIETDESAYILIPFKITDADYKIGELLGAQLIGNIPKLKIDVNDKIISREICTQLGGRTTYGFDCYNIKSILEAINVLLPKGKIVVKEYDGVSGQGFYIISDSSSLKVFNAILRRHDDSENFRLLIEKWYDDCVDLNYQIYIARNGDIMQFAPTKQIIKNGVYVGTDFEIQNYISEDDIFEINCFGKQLANYLYKNGYYGNISVDTIKSTNCLFHLVEINARLSLSSYFGVVTCKYRGKKIIIQYYNIPAAAFSLHDFFKEFCTEQTDSGVLVLSSGIDSSNNTCRLFLMFFAENKADLHSIKHEVEKYIMR